MRNIVHILGGKVLRDDQNAPKKLAFSVYNNSVNNSLICTFLDLKERSLQALDIGMIYGKVGGELWRVGGHFRRSPPPIETHKCYSQSPQIHLLVCGVHLRVPFDYFCANWTC